MDSNNTFVTLGMSKPEVHAALNMQPSFLLDTMEYYENFRVDYDSNDIAVAFEFFSNSNLYKAILDAATFADENNLWKPSSGNPADFADKAKVTVINRAVGVTGDGVELFIINLYRTAKNMVHGCPGN